MPPFASSIASAPLQINTYPPLTNDAEFDSPTDSLASLHLRPSETADTLQQILPKPSKSLQLPRPDYNQRSTTDPSPSPSNLLQSYFANMASAPQRPSSSNRTRSPYSRSHLRSRSSGSALMTTTSGASSSGSLSPMSGGPHSPMRSPACTRSPLQQEDSVWAPPPPRSPAFASTAGAIESIDEDSELDTSPTRDTLGPLPGTPSSMSSFNFSISRSGSLRRRPASPLHSTTPPTSNPSHESSAVSSGANSPSLGPQKNFNEAYPTLHHYASSSSFSSLHSAPSTPTSARSRSPSISSLETIEDAPDAESEAFEAERIQTLKLAAERQERLERGEDVDGGEEGVTRRRGSFESGGGGKGFGFGRVGRERKRWSVCGGERRGDLLDLETIWED
ncbi:hypothetical protein LTS14_009230 [Recurvomyces mirabilis]|uniref:uncharacterized protein n=1 Tax=Recurvomyces mirabilis TaxID=574656 RepID=UPI002DE1A0FD|nr:hypothetical protein LTS14_009230 [Recurvomyces mirabilis]